VFPGTDIWPATYETICHWLYWVTWATTLATAVKYLSAVRSYHIDAMLPYLPNIQHRVIIRRVCVGLSRTIPMRAQPLRELVTPLALFLFVASLGHLQDDVDTCLFLAASALACWRALRGYEFTCPTGKITKETLLMRHWRFAGHALNGSFLDIPCRKMDKAAIDSLFYPTLVDNPSCPMLLMSYYILARSAAGLSLAPDSALLMCADGLPLSRDRMILWTEAALRAANLHQGGKLTARSWRSGTATQSVASGLPLHITKLLGSWSSDSAPKHYIRLHDDREHIRAAILTMAGDAAKAAADLNTALTSIN
jgi:uncharacterized membrane protein (GlpM family)